jgi:predicted transcriptional regulator
MTELTPQQIAKCLSDIGRTQTDLADLLGCSRPLVTQLITGKRPLAAWRERVQAALVTLAKETLVVRREQGAACREWVKSLRS